MAGNSRRRGAIRKSGTKKGPVVGSGGQRRRALEGRGPTPPAHLRPNHPAAKRAQPQHRRPARRTDETETVLGRNPVLECLRAGVPATALYVALGTEADERLTESVSRAADLGISILEVPRTDLDRMTTNHLHQGIALQVPPYNYAHPDDLLEAAPASPPALLVALDNISDPRNLGAIVRSVAAFGGHGVVIPQRRSASVTAVAWRTSAGAAARLRVARATNLTRTLKDWADRGLRVIGLDAGGDTMLDDIDGTDPTVVVVGSEGKGAVAVGAAELRRGGVDPDGRARRIAECVGGRRGGARRNRAPAQELTPIARPACRAFAVVLAAMLTVSLVPVGAAGRKQQNSTCRPIAEDAGRPPRNHCARSPSRSKLGVSTLELDVVITKDGQPLVWHDPTIEAEKCTDTGPRSPAIRSIRMSASWSTSSPWRSSARWTADVGSASSLRLRWCTATR